MGLVSGSSDGREGRRIGEGAIGRRLQSHFGRAGCIRSIPCARRRLPAPTSGMAWSRTEWQGQASPTLAAQKASPARLGSRAG